MAFVISLIGIIYTYYQNRRKIEVDLWLDNENKPLISLCAYNSGYRSVALINYRFIVDNKSYELTEGLHEADRSKNGDNTSSFSVKFTKKFDFPYMLEEGNAAIYSITAQNLAVYLHYNGVSGVVKLSGYYKTAQKKKEKSKSGIDFDIEKYYVG